ncbi:hypothetical protein ACQKWADRAFT_327990 [Trichoderma austrokoningii]
MIIWNLYDVLCLQLSRNPFVPIDPDGMTWDDLKASPAVDYSDETFVVTREPKSTVFGNSLPIVSSLAREDVPKYYRDLLDKLTDLNHGHTMHEYWMEDSHGRYGVDLASRDIQMDASAAWQIEVGNNTSFSFELVFIVLARQDESSTWQEGPKNTNGSLSLPNYSSTRYVPWTSWASASTIWPSAGARVGNGNLCSRAQPSVNIGDNYNNPYGIPPQRDYTGPYSMMSRGSANGTGGSVGSLHTVRDKLVLGFISNDTIITARSVVSELIGLRVDMNRDLSPTGNSNNQPFQWTIDANPQDIKLVDLIRPNGTAAMITMDDYRQLAEFVDEANAGVLPYTVAARCLADASSGEYEVRMTSGMPLVYEGMKSILCEVELTNNGTYSSSSKGHAQIQSEHLGYEKAAKAYVAVRAEIRAKDAGMVKLAATLESDPTVEAELTSIV